MKKTLLLGAVAAALIWTGCATGSTTQGNAATDEAPQHTIPVMSWDEVNTAVQAGAVLVDARGSNGYAKGHITGAINVPCRDEAAFANLPSDKNTMLIFYCGGPRCSASNKAAHKALDLGYTQVAEYKAGYPEWAAAQATP